jgi:radical SAM protein with 4Fe4S-binding SPASM domain
MQISSKAKPNHFFSELSSPINVQFELTYNCNNGCFFCYNCSNTNPKSKVYLDTSKIYKIIDKLKANSVQTLIFTGGEVTLCDNLADILNYSKQAGFQTYIISNGRNINHELLKKIPDLNIQISLLGSTSQMHDMHTCVDGSFTDVIRSLEILKEHNTNEICSTYTVSMVVTKHNIDDVFNTAKLAKMYGVTSFSVQKMMDCGSARSIQDALLSRDDINRMFITLCEIEKTLQLNVTSLSPFPYCAIEDLDNHHRFASMCTGALAWSGITPDGDLKMCPNSSESFGNILKTPLQELWTTNDTLIRYRKGDFLPKECNQCKMISACKGGCRVVVNQNVIDNKIEKLANLNRMEIVNEWVANKEFKDNLLREEKKEALAKSDTTFVQAYPYSVRIEESGKFIIAYTSRIIKMTNGTIEILESLKSKKRIDILLNELFPQYVSIEPDFNKFKLHIINVLLKLESSELLSIK